MLWTPNTPCTRHLTKCPPPHLPSLSRLPSSRRPRLCFQHETGSKVLLVCMIHKGWNGDGTTQLMLTPTTCPNAKDELQKCRNYLRPCLFSIPSHNLSSSKPAGFCPTIRGNHCYCHSVFPSFFFFFWQNLSLFFFYITIARGHNNGSMGKNLRVKMSKHHDVSGRLGWYLTHESHITSFLWFVSLVDWIKKRVDSRGKHTIQIKGHICRAVGR